VYVAKLINNGLVWLHCYIILSIFYIYLSLKTIVDIRKQYSRKILYYRTITFSYLLISYNKLNLTICS